MPEFQIKPLNFLAKLAAMALLAGVGGLLISHGGFLFLLGAILLGAMFAHAVELQHQCLHHTAFASSRLNRLVGRGLGLPMLVSYSHYRNLHFRHHAHLGTDQETPFFEYSASVLFSIFSLSRYTAILKDCARAVVGIAPDNLRGAASAVVISEYRAFVLFLTVVAVTAFFFPLQVISFYLVPLLFAESIHRLIELPEHFKCPESIDVFESTRSIRGSAFSFWFTNGNNFHVEHHLNPSVPIDHLPEIHRRIGHKLKHSNRTYVEFFLEAAGVSNRRRP